MIDPLKLLRALEDFLFEAMALLFFYPVTLFRIARRPREMMLFAESEEIANKETRYNDAVSPPLMLLLTILLMHYIGLATHAEQPEGSAALSTFIFDTPEYLLLFRCLLFSLLPLVAAVTLLRKQGQPISRDTLRPAFYAQCYVTVPLAMALSVGLIFVDNTENASALTGAAICTLGVVWLLWAQTAWYQHKLQRGLGRSLLIALGVTARAAVYFLSLAIGVSLL